jgi:hypothetical protein
MHTQRPFAAQPSARGHTMCRTCARAATRGTTATIGGLPSPSGSTRCSAPWRTCFSMKRDARALWLALSQVRRFTGVPEGWSGWVTVRCGPGRGGTTLRPRVEFASTGWVPRRQSGAWAALAQERRFASAPGRWGGWGTVRCGPGRGGPHHGACVALRHPTRPL